MTCAGDVGARSHGVRDEPDVPEVARGRARRPVAGQQPERAQLVGRHAFGQQVLLGDRRVLEHLVEPGRDARVGGDRRGHPRDVVDQRRSGAVVLPAVQPHGKRPRAVLVERACGRQLLSDGHVSTSSPLQLDLQLALVGLDLDLELVVDLVGDVHLEATPPRSNSTSLCRASMSAMRAGARRPPRGRAAPCR